MNAKIYGITYQVLMVLAYVYNGFEVAMFTGVMGIITIMVVNLHERTKNDN